MPIITHWTIRNHFTSFLTKKRFYRFFSWLFLLKDIFMRNKCMHTPPHIDIIYLGWWLLCKLDHLVSSTAFEFGSWFLKYQQQKNRNVKKIKAIDWKNVASLNFSLQQQKTLSVWCINAWRSFESNNKKNQLIGK